MSVFLVTLNRSQSDRNIHLIACLLLSPVDNIYGLLVVLDAFYSNVIIRSMMKLSLRQLLLPYATIKAVYIMLSTEQHRATFITSPGTENKYLNDRVILCAPSTYEGNVCLLVPSFIIDITFI